MKDFPDSATKGKRVLVTGASGRIGERLIHWLESESKCDLILTSRRKPEFKSQKTTWIQGDLRSVADLDKIFRQPPDIVVHLASSVGHKNSSSIVSFEDTELVPTLSLLDYIISKKLNVRFIFASSGGTVYKDSVVPHSENEAVQGSSLYSCNKIFVENLLWLNRQYLHPVILRISNPFGMKINPNISQGIIDVAADCAMNNKIFNVYGNMDNVRDFVFIDDLCQAFVKTLEFSDSNYEIFNIGSGIGISISEIMEYVKTYFPKFRYTINYVENCDISCNILNISKASRMLDWNPSVSVEAYLKRKSEQALIKS